MSAVTSPLIVDVHRRYKLSFVKVLIQLLRTGLRSNSRNAPAESEDGCYAALLLFIALCSLLTAMILSCMMVTDSLTYGVVSMLMIFLTIVSTIILLYFIKSKKKWIDSGILLQHHEPSMNNTNEHNNINELRDISENDIPPAATTTRKHNMSSVSLIGIYIFGSLTLIMFSVDIIQVTTCLPFTRHAYNTDRYVSEDVLYIVLRIFSNVFFCVQVAFFISFKNIKLVSSPLFCYSFLMFVTVDFIYMLEGLVYVGFFRLNIVLPWQARENPEMEPGDYDLLCYNRSRHFDDSVFVMQDTFYPFTIEFYILSIGIFLHHWFSLVSSSFHTNTDLNAYDDIDADEDGRGRGFEIRNRSSALPLAVFMSLLMLGSAAFLFSESIVGIVIYIYHTIRLIFQILLVIPVMLGARYLSHFRYYRKESLDGSEMLLFSTVSATFLVSAFTGLTSSVLLYQFNTMSADEIPDRDLTPGFNVTAADSVLCLSYAVVNYFQIITQTCLLISARRRFPPTRETTTTFRLRECFLYLAICNACILATDTFFAIQTFRVESSTNVWYFGARSWNIIESVLFPVAELYHFHSILLCSELYMFFKVN